MSFCEVRIPTYKRPVWLRRSLDSLLAQDCSAWKAIVIDDSPDQEGKKVVNDIGDRRISYFNNSENLGGAANLDRAFSSQSLMGGEWACVLEDDNWLMPSYLTENIRALELHQVGILLRNQEVWFQTQYGVRPTGKTTRGNWFKERSYDPIELQAHLFFFEGISNGGLFWNTSIESNLHVGPKVKDSGLQEHCRTLQIVDPVYFKAEPLCVWSEMPTELISRSFLSARSRSRGLQSIRRHLIRKYGGQILDVAHALSANLSLTKEFETALLDALYLSYHFRVLTKFNALKRCLRSYAKYVWIADPLKDYFAESGQAGTAERKTSPSTSPARENLSIR